MRRRRGSQGGRGPESTAPARFCLAFAPRCPAMLGSGAQTSFNPPGLWKPLPSPPTHNEQTGPLAGLRMGSFLLRHTNPTPTSRYGPGPPARGPTALSTRPQPSTPPGEAGGPSYRRDGGGSAQPGAYNTPDGPVPLGASNRVHAGLFQGEEGWKDARRVQITFHTCCGARATEGWIPGG